MIINHIFPQVVAKYQMQREFTEKELKYIHSLEYVKNNLNYATKRTDIFESEELKDLYSFCKNALDQYVKEVIQPKSNSVKIRITESWINKTNKNESHHIHSHPNSFLSGVLYVNTTNSDTITFYESNYHRILIPTENYTINNSLVWRFEALIGVLYIFDSKIIHGVDPIFTTHPRISISFNSFPIGNLSSEVRGNNLTIKDVE